MATSVDLLLGSDVPTLADALRLAGQDASLKLAQRAQLQSAVRVFCRALRRDPAMLPAAALPLRPLLKQFHPIHAGLTERRWQNILSLLRQAIGRYGITDGRLNKLMPMSPEWTVLYDRLADWGARAGLSHFLRYCSAVGVRPSQVDDIVSSNYLAFLVDTALKSAPRNTHQRVVRGWKRAVTNVAGWPRQSLTLPRYRESYVLPDERFPSSLIQEMGLWCARLSGKDPVAEDLPPRPVKDSTAKRRGFQLRQIASAHVHRGGDAGGLKSLGDLVQIETLREALRFFTERADNKSTKQIFELALTAESVARHWLHLPEERLRRLKALRQRLVVPQHGMTARNRAVLRQFEDAQALAALFRFGTDEFAAARRQDRGGIRPARQAAVALAVELLIWCPIRITNLVGIHLDDHICRSRSSNGPVHLAIPAAEVKNREALEFTLPPHLVRMIDEFVRIYRPRLAPPSSRFLFAGKLGHVGRHGFGAAISRRIFDATGLTINPHAFRHLSAMLYLRENPGGFEVVRRTLAHRNPATTINAYMGLEGKAAAQHFDDTILRIRKRTLGEPL